MNLPRRRDGEWSIEALDSRPFRLMASYSEGGERTLICAGDGRIEVLRESADRRRPIVPAMNCEVDDEVGEEDLIQLLRDIRVAVSNIQGSLRESGFRSLVRDSVSRSVRRFVESVDGGVPPRQLNETGSVHQGNRLADFTLEHNDGDHRGREGWSIVVRFKGSFGREVSKLMGIGEEIASDPIYDLGDAKRILSGKFSEFRSIFGDRPTMPGAIEDMWGDRDRYERNLSHLLYGFSDTGR